MGNEKWTAEKVPGQTGKVVIVTGASSGIGYEAARVLANKGARAIIAVRNAEKGTKALEKIKAQNKNADVRVMPLDLADLKSVAAFAEAFKREYAQLDLLINNAGVMIPPYSKTNDGFELQFGTNHLGHFALTGQLLEILEKTNGSRVVNVSSGAHNVGNLDFNDLNWERRSYSAWRAYGDSKIANLYFTYELDRRLKAHHFQTIVTAAHPGYTATELQRNSSFIELFNFLGQNVSMGALPTLRAATEEDLKGAEYFGPGGLLEMRGYPVKVESNQLSKDKKKAERLWEISEEMTKVKYDFGK